MDLLTSDMTRLMRVCGTWRNFSPQERSQWLQAWLLLPLIAVSLNFFKLRHVQAILDRLTINKPCRVDFPAVQALTRIFYIAVRWSYLPISCLAQSLVLCWLIRNQGLIADLRIGIAKPNGKFAAHAWVEHMGVTLDEQVTSQDFVPFNKVLSSSQAQTL
jgi:hypothetical protein